MEMDIFTLPSRVKMYAGIHANGYIHITFSSEDVFICMQMDIVTLPSQVKMYAGIHANRCIHITFSSEDVCRYSCKWIYSHYLLE